MTESAIKTKQIGGRLGTFAGVFTPSILTILGIILFRRSGFVVGQAGLGKMLLHRTRWIILLSASCDMISRIFHIDFHNISHSSG